jgi:CRISPR-associated protein Csx14
MDPTNPGQFYACCGLFELYEMYESGGLTWFERDRRMPRRAEFVLSAPAAGGVSRVLMDLRSCEFRPIQYENPKIAPVRFGWAAREMILDWWLTDDYTRDNPLKLWAGNQSSAMLMQRLVAAIPSDCSVSMLFELAQYTTTRLGVDPRSTWSKLDCGYSPNERDVKKAHTAPVVDLLAAVGLEGFRPGRERKDGMSEYVYALWGDRLPRAVARAAAVGLWPGITQAVYRFRLVDRGSYMGFDFAKERQDESR